MNSQYCINIPPTLVAASNVAAELLAVANPVGSRKAWKIENPSTNTGTLYVNLSSTNPTSAARYEALAPGESLQDNGNPKYQGPIRGLLSVAGPQNIRVWVG